ncbi:MAG: TonB-dependent receptor [Breznakibacter sp.]
MKRLLASIIALSPYLLFPLHAQKQIPPGYVKGRVNTSDGQPAEFIQVLIKDTGFGTVSNYKGEFSFMADAGKCTLVVQSIASHKKELEITIPENDTLYVPTIYLIENKQQLGEVVVTGQFEPQSVRNSVYRVRTIGPEQIAARGAVEIKTLLETQPGIRFSNDLATGESDIQLMGMSGQNVKILLERGPGHRQRRHQTKHQPDRCQQHRTYRNHRRPHVGRIRHRCVGGRHQLYLQKSSGRRHQQTFGHGTCAGRNRGRRIRSF